MPGFRVPNREDKVDGKKFKREYQVTIDKESGHRIINLGQAYWGPYYPWYCGEPCDFPHQHPGIPPTWCLCYSPVVPPLKCTEGNPWVVCQPTEDESGCIKWKTTSCTGGRCYWKLHSVAYSGANASCYCVYEYVYDDCDI